MTRRGTRPTVAALARGAAPLLVIVAVAAAVRWFRIGAESLWLDEGFSIAWARLPVGQLLSRCAEDVQAPLYYLALKAWSSAFGDTEAALRSLSAACGTLAVLALAGVGERLAGRRAGLLAAAWLAISPLHVLHSQEARSYALLTLLTALSYAGFLDVASGRGRSASVLHVVATALLLHVHALALMVPAAQLLHAAISRKPGLLRRTVAHLAVTALAYVPWAVVLARQALRMQGGGFWAPRPTLADLGHVARALAGSTELAAAAAILVVVALARRASPGPRPFGSSRSVLACWLLAPVLVPFLLSQVIQPIFLTRTSIPAALALAILAGMGLDALLARPVVGAAAAAGVLLLAASPLIRLHRAMENEDWRGATAQLEREATPDDLVLFDAGFCHEAAFAYYSTRNDLRTHALPDRAKLTDADREALRQAAAGARRLWLVRSHGRLEPDEVLPVIGARLTGARDFRGVRLLLLDRGGGPHQPPGGVPHVPQGGGGAETDRIPR